MRCTVFSGCHDKENDF